MRQPGSARPSAREFRGRQSQWASRSQAVRGWRLENRMDDDAFRMEIVSHQLMLRSGMVRKLTSGIYTWAPLGLRVLRKVEAIGIDLTVQPGDVTMRCNFATILSLDSFE